MQGTLNALEAASKQTSVKRFVITSSSAAVINPEPNRKGVKIDESKLIRSLYPDLTSPNMLFQIRGTIVRSSLHGATM